jgi:hypothetical protein
VLTSNHLDLRALRQSLPEILALSTLSGIFSRAAIVAYRDYSPGDGYSVQESSWSTTGASLQGFADQLVPSGGGDYPEAAKTALVTVLRKIKGSGRQTLVLWYADAPPHHPYVRSTGNPEREKDAIKAMKDEPTSDWVKLSHRAAEMGLTVFSFVPRHLDDEEASFYTLLSQLTGGICISSPVEKSQDISRLSLEVILQWMNQGSDIDSWLKATNVDFRHFEDDPKQFDIQDEDQKCRGFLPPSLTSNNKEALRAISSLPLQAKNIPICPTFAFTPADITRLFKDSSAPQHRLQVYTSLTTIINTNILALTYNNVFGKVWRAVCAEPASEEKQALLNAFSSCIWSVSDPQDKQHLQDWLEASYDATAKVNEMIEKHGDTTGPQIYLDFDADVQLTRIELLEVAKSCYSEVLKKLTTIFTHLKVTLIDPFLAHINYIK